jgi:hypothetical protein
MVLVIERTTQEG